MYWKVACNLSPKGTAVKQLKTGFILRGETGRPMFYTYKDFPHNARPATEEELQEDSGWFPLMKPLVSR